MLCTHGAPATVSEVVEERHLDRSRDDEAMPDERCAVIVFANDDPLPMAFASLQAAAGYMEAIDVEDGLYSDANPTSGLRGRATHWTPESSRPARTTARSTWWPRRSRTKSICAPVCVKWPAEAHHGRSQRSHRSRAGLLEQQWESRWPRRPRVPIDEPGVQASRERRPGDRRRAGRAVQRPGSGQRQSRLPIVSSWTLFRR